MVLIIIVLSLCKIKNIVIAIIYSFLVGTSVYMVHTYGDYVRFGKELAIEQNLTDTSETKALADKFLESETGTSGVCGYVKYVAKVGIITKSSKSHQVTKHEGADAWMEIGFDLLSYVAVSIGCIYYYMKDKKKEELDETANGALNQKN
ncbi:hypothetical protein KYD98_06190 [Clostridium sp. YB-6]|uniref:Uncharacterized protein n=1 Tax=Clostridium weizhouense TaxID=2859781 RepID=A0ABS7AMP4_9CLOT|nr:hypothetical protein [Clostridium weizhouense]